MVELAVPRIANPDRLLFFDPTASNQLHPSRLLCRSRSASSISFANPDSPGLTVSRSPTLPIHGRRHLPIHGHLLGADPATAATIASFPKAVMPLKANLVHAAPVPLMRVGRRPDLPRPQRAFRIRAVVELDPRPPRHTMADVLKVTPSPTRPNGLFDVSEVVT